MKNIHLLYTDKPSRLFYLASNLHLEQGQLISPKNYQNIYITSDEKTVPGKGDWYLGHPLYTSIHRWHTDVSKIDGRNVWINKIILTTDQDLIKYGVQAIDDEFLEWFVKNPSCESVEVEIETTSIQLPQQQLSENSYDLAFRWINKKVYKIIIPKEEPKQETLEEVAEKFLIKQGCQRMDCGGENCDLFEDVEPKDLIEFTKWQQERMYSEEEVLDLLYKRDLYLLNRDEEVELELPDDWFEQFKNNDEIIDDSIFDIKIKQPTNQSDKIKYFNYFLYKLYQHKGSKNDFGKNKINPLFFFLLNAVDGYILYDIFDDFYALPYGPIEKTINHLIKNQEELSFTITRFDLDKKSDFILFQDENTKLIDKAFDKLVTTGLIEKSVSYMVDLSMEHESLLNARRNAIKENKLAYPISNDDLKNELKFFYE